MITSFFAPKPSSSAKANKPGGSKKRPRDDASERDEPPPCGKASAGSRSNDGKSSGGQLPDETAALLAHLHPETDGDDSGSSSSPAVSWRGSLEKHFAAASFASLARFVAGERRSRTVYPPARHTFSALNLTPLRSVRVVIVGQDPYHQPGQGHGLSFSVPRGVKVPPSLRNVYKELVDDGDVPDFVSRPEHGNLERWARQGVLLLNNVLTVRRGEAASHSKRGWEEFTDRVISAVLDRDEANEEGKGVVFLLWGKPASKKATAVLGKTGGRKKSKHAVISCSHPSPLGATKTASPFLGSRCFSRANEELVRRGWPPVDWRVDGRLPEEEAEEEEEVGKSEEEEEAVCDQKAADSGGDEEYDDV